MSKTNYADKPRVIVIYPDEKPWKPRASLKKIERIYRRFPESEVIPYARGTSFVEIAENVIRDKDGMYAHPIYLFESKHSTTIGVSNLAKKTNEFLINASKKYPMDILSVSAGIDGDRLSVVCLVRVYKAKPSFSELQKYLNEKDTDKTGMPSGPRLVIPPGVYRDISDKERRAHIKAIKLQNEALLASDADAPFLNRIDSYVPRRLANIDERQELVYDLRTRDMQIQINIGYRQFIDIFNEAMNYITMSERDSYYNVLRGQMEKNTFFDVVKAYIQRTFVATNRLPKEDVPALVKKIDRALFELYIVQDLIDDPMITDIKITDPYSIRVRVKGKAYLSNITFIDPEDYKRFINGIAVMNGIDLRVPAQTFTDEQDENYILRFSITTPYVMCSGFPTIHIRKIPRNKLMSEDLIRIGMMDEKIRDYLIDCGKYSQGVVFAGPPGSGKTTCLNWFIEDAYESSAEILIIQENDELFAYRRGVMIEHVVINPRPGERACSLEDLGKMALVAGANVFVIGEAKGAEITSAITLSNSGCRTAITIHSQSSTDTIDKMVDLALRGSSNITYDQAKRMIKSFQTIVYMEDFKIQEISEIIGYDEEKRDMIYRPIYIRPGRKRTGVFAVKKERP